MIKEILKVNENDLNHSSFRTKLLSQILSKGTDHLMDWTQKKSQRPSHIYILAKPGSASLGKACIETSL